MELKYRLGTINDIDEICNLIHDAIVEMESHSIFQWDDFYPTREDFMKDIKDGNLYVVLSDEKLAAIYVINDESDDAYKEV